MMSSRYILIDGKPVPEPDLIKWATWFETTENRRIAYDRIGDTDISTVFLGLDHNFGGEGPPILYETMIFGGERDGETHRYATLEEAKAGHEQLLNSLLPNE